MATSGIAGGGHLFMNHTKLRSPKIKPTGGPALVKFYGITLLTIIHCCKTNWYDFGSLWPTLLIFVVLILGLYYYGFF